MNVEQASLKKSTRLRLSGLKRNAPTQNLSNDEQKEVTNLTGSTIIPSPQSAPYGGCMGNSIIDNYSDERQHDNTGSTAHMTRILPEEGPIDVPGDDYTMGGSTLRARSPTVQDLHKSRSRIWTVPTRRPQVHPDIFEDPVADAFWTDAWVASAVHNVCIFTIYTSNSLH